MKIKLAEFEKLEKHHGVPFPTGQNFRQFIITGPPGSGKSTLVSKIHGWPIEGYIDLTREKWWRDRSLTFRPREVHLGFPFVGEPDALTVFDSKWFEKWDRLVLEEDRISIPPPPRWAILPNWRKRFVFEFLLPPAEESIVWRKQRNFNPAFPTERNLTVEKIQCQNDLHLQAALHMQRCGMSVYVRQGYDQLPQYIVDETEQSV